MKLVVAHTGARRGYAVAAILERAGMLGRLYTDICADVGLGRLLTNAAGVFGENGSTRKLASRKLPPELILRTKTFALPNIGYFLRKHLAGRDPVKQFRENVRWQCRLGDLMAREGFGEANFLHAFLDEFPTLMRAAKERGLKIFSEIYILLSTDRLLAEERRQFPGWEAEVPDYEAISESIFPERPLFKYADYALCPSEAVRDDAVRNFGFARERTVVVPYGVGDTWFDIRNQPIRGRVLFVGTADLRKGIHYLGMAAEKLWGQGYQYEFRIAGNVERSITMQPICRRLTFLGRIPRSEVAAEFESADVLVLPSLAEGSAGVTYEALAAGLPLITTNAAGSVIRDGVEGCLVAERDPDGLASAIVEIIEDRNKRDRMAAAARERAREFTWEKYGDRLVAALRTFAR